MRNVKALGKKIADALLAPLGLGLVQRGVAHFPEAEPADAALVEKFQPYTMTDPHRMWTLLRAVDYIDAQGLAGDIVECGVWRGGNLMLAKERRKGRDIPRKIYGFDTFEGFTEPTDVDVNTDGRSAVALYRVDDPDIRRVRASLQEVTDNLRRVSLFGDDIVLRKGRVEETLVGDDIPENIALLRLDTDWYQSTKVELEVLYPRLVQGGVLILDDYGSWLGSKKAVDDYFADKVAPLLIPVTRICRMAIKV